jgi:hypothetical protein
MRNFGFLFKLSLLSFLTAAILVSCITEAGPPKKRNPQNISIPGHGKLVYTGTLFSGNAISETVVDGDIIWSLDSFYGKIYRYDKITKKTITLDVEKKDKDSYNSVYSIYYYYGFPSKMAIQNNYLIIPFVINNQDDFYYTVKINRSNASLSYEKASNMFNGQRFNGYFFHDDKTYFEMLDNTSESTFYATADFINYTAITEEDYLSARESLPVYHTDSAGRLYDPGYEFRTNSESYNGKPDTYLRVSVDNGNTWVTGDMGTNFPVSVTSKDNTIYVSSEIYHETFNGIFFPLPTIGTGGGLNIFQWEK